MPCNTDYISIPVELCKYAIQEHKLNQLRLYIFLKYECSGHLRLPKERIKGYCLQLGYKTPKTFNTNLKWLLQNEWVIENKHTGNYRIMGFFDLHNKLNFSSSKGAIFEPIDYSKFKAFCAAAVVTYFMIYKSRCNKKRPELLTRSSRVYRSKKPAFYTLPHSYLAQVLKISKSCAKNFRDLAIKYGFINSIHQFEEVKIPQKEISTYLKYSEPEAKNLIGFKNKLIKQHNDVILSNVVLRTKSDYKFKRKKSAPIKRG